MGGNPELYDHLLGRKRVVMKPSLPILILLLLSAVRGACDGVSVIRVSDGKVVAKDSPAFFDIYRDMILTVDDVGGKVAIIRWGRHKSTIKILGLADGNCAKHSVNIGRENGIDGAEYYDFASGDYIFHDSKGLHFFGKNSKPREISNPLPNNYGTGTIVPCRDGLLIKAGNGAGDYRGAIVYHYCQSEGSIKKIYETSETIRALASGGDCAIVSEDVQGDYRSRHILRVGLDGRILSKIKMPMLSETFLRIRDDRLWDAGASTNGTCHLQATDLERGRVIRQVELSSGAGIHVIDVLDNLVVTHRQKKDSGDAVATVIDFDHEKVLRQFDLKWPCIQVSLLKYDGEAYCILSE